ncbi:P22 phage major capsid protein family protein [Prauserella oleivorans]|uniref:P22 phage major capsid protein family protein n=1 Tax=Prauserella oleivorans TaxID=1478153 RepID=A0ABW5W917_9PSEU
MAVTAFIPQIWSAFLQTAFQEREVIASTLTREFEGEAVRGNVVRVPFAATPSVVDYAAAGRTINAEEATVTTVDVPVDHEDAFAVKIDDVDRAQAAGSFEPVMRAASGALVEKYETRLAEMLLTGGTALDGSGTDAADGDAAFDVVMDLRQALSQAKAPLGERFLIVNPEFSRMLLGADSKLTSVDAAGDAAGLRQATIGQLAGFTVVETAILSPGRQAAIGLHSSAAAFVSQINETEAVRAHNAFADVVRGLHVSGHAVLRPEAVVVFQGAAPAAG